MWLHVAAIYMKMTGSKQKFHSLSTKVGSLLQRPGYDSSLVPFAARHLTCLFSFIKAKAWKGNLNINDIHWLKKMLVSA